MAKAAVLESSPNNFPFHKVRSDVTMKRKTPSELRGELLKRRNYGSHVDEELPPLLDSDKINFGAINGFKKPESSKVPKYISTRVNEVYPVKKSSERCKMIFGKEKVKDFSTVSSRDNDLNGSSATCSIPTNDKPSLSCENAVSPRGLECSDSSTEEIREQGFRKIEKCSQNALHNVVRRRLGNDKSSDSAKVDMQKALKGFVARDIPATSGSLGDSLGLHVDLPSISSTTFASEFHIPGHKTPLDFTLKTALRLVSSSSVKWCHRLNASTATIDPFQFSSQFCCNKDQKLGCTSGLTMTTEDIYFKSLRSWVYPQSSLPASIISAMSLSATKGGNDFVLRRQQDWEDSFRNLYYMLRKDLCNIFYVYTIQFVVLFVAGNFLGKKHSCNAYLSQSTRGLRSLLKKHGIYFSMPLCRVEGEQAAEDDLLELSEIEKRNLGQTFHLDSMSDVDNSPQSLLAFIGNKNVHALFEFLFNYRFILNSLTVADVPVLYAPVPFQNASLSLPEMRCKEMKRADVVLPSNGPDTMDAEAASLSPATGMCYSIEIKDTHLPPWVVSGVCAAMRSEERSFDCSFTTDPSSIGLNIALDSVSLKTDISSECMKPLPESGSSFGIPDVVRSPCLRLASLRRLKYSDGSYVAYTTPV